MKINIQEYGGNNVEIKLESEGFAEDLQVKYLYEKLLRTNLNYHYNDYDNKIFIYLKDINK